MEDTSRNTLNSMAIQIIENVIGPIIGDVHAIYSTVTLAKKPIDERDGPVSGETPSLETVQRKCRNLDVQYKWIAKQIEDF
jgi:hypothetical protein